MAKYYVKGEVLTTLEEQTKKGKNAKGKTFEKSGIFVTVKDPILCDKKGNPLSEEEVEKVCNAVADELEGFAPKWAMNDFKDTEYLNLNSQYAPSLYRLTPDGVEKVEKGDVIVNHATAIVYCNNTYHNSILVIEEGHENANPWDDDFE